MKGVGGGGWEEAEELGSLEAPRIPWQLVGWGSGMVIPPGASPPKTWDSPYC